MTVPGTKLSQIALAGAPPALSDTLVGVGGGTTDLQYSLTQIKTTIATAPGGNNTDIKINNGGALGGDDFFQYSGNGAVSIGGSGHTGSIAFKGTTSGVVTIQSQDVAGTWTFKWPTTAGTNTYVLTTDGSGVTSWTAPGSTANLVVGTSTISGGTTKHVAYDLTGVFQEAANFTIESGNPNVTAGNAYLYDNTQVITAQIALDNFYEGGAGNLTGTGARNLATGTGALVAVTSGTDNTAYGTSALAANQTGGFNFAFGTRALEIATAPDNCTAIGAFAMVSATGGMNILAIGSGACTSNTTGEELVAVGRSVLGFNLTGKRCTGVGSECLFENTAGNDNTAVGYNALKKCLGDENTAVGKECFGIFAGSGQTLNTGFGSRVAQAEQSGIQNTYVGRAVAFGANGASNNTCLGYASGAGLSTGSNNILIGYSSAGQSQVTSGTGNVSIGYDVAVATATANNQLCISNYIYGTGLGGTNTTISSGKIGLGIKAPNFNLDVAGSLGCAEATAILHNSTTVTGGATGNVPTLTAGPVTGNPTKWLPYDDNGTTRYIPAW